MDFFTVPTLTFGVLYCFFFIAHDKVCIIVPTLPPELLLQKSLLNQ